MDARPDFVLIGAMKSATTTLHHQLSRQPALFLAQPKEPNFFSDDENFARGLSWYSELFRKAPSGALRGESSTHYTKLPTYPRTVERMKTALPNLNFLYVMRHPIDRLVSHFRHERNVGAIDCGIEEAVETHPRLLDYGRYAYQLEPYLEVYGRANVLPIFFDRLVHHPQKEFDRIGRFLGVRDRLVWDASLKPQNVTDERLKRSPMREAIVKAPLLTPLRQKIVPKLLSEPIKGFFKESLEMPVISTEFRSRLADVFDADLDRLGEWLGIELDCENFSAVTRECSREWANL